MADSKNKEKAGTKRKRGRPVKHPMPERIDATPEEVAEVVLQAKPKTDWCYLKERSKPR